MKVISQKVEIMDLLTDPVEKGGCGEEWGITEAETFVKQNMQHVIKCAEYGLNPYDSIAYIFWSVGLSQFSPTESDVYLSKLPEIINKNKIQ